MKMFWEIEIIEDKYGIQIAVKVPDNSKLTNELYTDEIFQLVHPIVTEIIDELLQQYRPNPTMEIGLPLFVAGLLLRRSYSLL